jgi:hypothetical protein
MSVRGSAIGVVLTALQAYKDHILDVNANHTDLMARWRNCHRSNGKMTYAINFVSAWQPFIGGAVKDMPAFDTKFHAVRAPLL